MSEWAAAFAEQVADDVASSVFARDFPFTMVTSHVMVDEAIFIGRSQPGRVYTGVTVRTNDYGPLFSWDLHAATGAFSVELMEPGWVKGDPPSLAATAWAEQRFPGIWWMAAAPPPPAVARPGMG